MVTVTLNELLGMYEGGNRTVYTASLLVKPDCLLPVTGILSSCTSFSLMLCLKNNKFSESDPTKY